MRAIAVDRTTRKFNRRQGRCFKCSFSSPNYYARPERYLSPNTPPPPLTHAACEFRLYDFGNVQGKTIAVSGGGAARNTRRNVRGVCVRIPYDVIFVAKSL